MVAGDFGVGFQRTFQDVPLLLLLVTSGLLGFHLGENGSWRVFAATIFGMLLGVLVANLDVAMPFAHWVGLGGIALLCLAIAINLEAPMWPSLVAMAVPSLYLGRAVLGLGQFGLMTWLGMGTDFILVMAATLGLANLVAGTGGQGAVRVGAGAVAVFSVLILAGVIA